MYLSHFIDFNTPCYGGKSDLINIKSLSSIKNGDTSNSVQINISSHVGTHIDFPRHFDDNGKTLSDYDSSYWIFNKVGFIESGVEDFPNMLNEIKADIEILILKTNFGKFRGNDEYWASQPVIPSSYASILRRKFSNLKVFGFDLISLTSKLDREEGRKSHISFLLENDILVIEDMNLINLKICPDKIIVAPLLISNLDGSPCTIIAL